MSRKADTFCSDIAMEERQRLDGVSWWRQCSGKKHPKGKCERLTSVASYLYFRPAHAKRIHVIFSYVIFSDLSFEFLFFYFASAFLYSFLNIYVYSFCICVYCVFVYLCIVFMYILFKYLCIYHHKKMYQFIISRIVKKQMDKIWVMYKGICNWAHFQE